MVRVMGTLLKCPITELDGQRGVLWILKGRLHGNLRRRLGRDRADRWRQIKL